MQEEQTPQIPNQMSHQEMTMFFIPSVQWACVIHEPLGGSHFSSALVLSAGERWGSGRWKQVEQKFCSFAWFYFDC